MTTSTCSQEISVVESASLSKIKLPPQPARLLVAVNEELAASGLKDNLTALGYTVIGPARNGDEATELCQTARPDLALVDIRMPTSDGLEAAEAIFRNLSVPVVIVSVDSDPQHLSAGTKLGVFAYLIKPVSQDQLRMSITVAWERFLIHAAQDAEIQELKQRLEDRKTIEQAKWVIVKRKGVSEPAAMRLLQKQARNNRRPLVELARSILENESLFADD